MSNLGALIILSAARNIALHLLVQSEQMCVTHRSLLSKLSLTNIMCRRSGITCRRVLSEKEPVCVRGFPQVNYLL